MNIPKIESYQFGKIVVDGQLFEKDVIICPDRILPNWRRENGHSLSMDDLKELMLEQFKVIILGTGKFGQMKIPDETLFVLQALGVKVIAAKTQIACQLYNQHKDEGGVIAALHLTC